jgi:hypothetical protein
MVLGLVVRNVARVGQQRAVQLGVGPYFAVKGLNFFRYFAGKGAKFRENFAEISKFR